MSTSFDTLHQAGPVDVAEGLDFKLDVIRRYTEHLANGTTDNHPDGPRFMPAGEYLDADVHASDLAMLRRTPLVVAHCSQLPGSGTFLAENLLGTPLLLVRQKDGTVKAFLNSCIHRGAKLADGSGSVNGRFVCPYHSWSYRPDGRLATVSQPEKFGAFDKSCHSLIEVACSERYGLIFVTLDGAGITDVDEFLGDFADVVAQARLDELDLFGTWPESQPMNWKIALSTYYESYHIKTVHKNTVAPFFVGNLSTHDAYGPSGRHLVTTWATNAMEEYIELDEAQRIEKLADGAPYIKVLFLFPNVVITGDDAGHSFSHLIRVTPGPTSGEQLTDFRMMKRPGLRPEVETFIDDFAKVTLYALEEEDYATVTHTATALATGLQRGLNFGANEMTLTEMHRGWASAAGRPLPDQPIDR